MAEPVLSPNAVYSAIPTVRLNGQPDDKVTAQLLAMQMSEYEGGMSALELRFSNFGSFAGGVGSQVFEDGKDIETRPDARCLRAAMSRHRHKSFMGR